MTNNKETAIATRETTPSTLTTSEGLGFSSEAQAVLRQTLCKDATDAELQLFGALCKSKQLDPFSSQIYMIKRRAYNKDTKKYDSKVSFQTGIDGFRALAARSGEYAGSDEPEYEEYEDGTIKLARVCVWRIVKGERVAFRGVARWAEFCPPEGQDNMWKKMPYHMIGKVAEAQALRKGFPLELSGLFTPEEMERTAAIEAQIDDEPRPAPAAAVTQRIQQQATAAPTGATHQAAEPPVLREWKRALIAFKQFGIDELKMLDKIGRPAFEDVVQDDFVKLRAWYDELQAEAEPGDAAE